MLQLMAKESDLLIIQVRVVEIEADGGDLHNVYTSGDGACTPR